MKNPNQRQARTLRVLAWILTAAATSVAWADTAGTPATPATTTTTTTTTSTTETSTPAGDVTTLEQMNVSSVPIDQQILPTARPIGSVMGDAESILDIPRSVTSVNEEWMKERNIRDTMDLGQFAPGVYSPSEYGLAAIPQIRGELAEIYVDGQTTKFNRNSILPSFNGVEAIDIVKGPGSAVYGPQSDAAGGYVNLVMKTPYFDATHGEVEVNWEGWSSGHSYSNPEFQLDIGGPISSTLAYRISYLSRYGDGYYQFSKNDTQDLYTALDWVPNKAFKVEFWAQYYFDRETSSPGFNRVTQNLLDNGIYIAGPANTLGLFGQTFEQGPYFFTLNPATAYTVKLQPYQILSSPYDFVHSDKFQTQLKATDQLTSHSSLVNLLYFEDETERQRSLYGYDNYVPLSWRLSDRLEYHDEFDIGSIKNQLITGLDAHRDRLDSYEDFSEEPISPYDLKASPYTWVLPGYFQTGTVGGFQAPGAFGFSGSSFTDTGSQDSDTTYAGAFLQDSVAFTDKLSGVVGIRGDYINGSAASPPFVNHPEGYQYLATGTAFDPSYFFSLVYKFTTTTSVYATYDRVDSAAGSANFAGLNGSGGNSGLVTSLKTTNKLYEVGLKESLFHDTLYASLALFQQDRRDPVAPPQIGPAQLNKDQGVEFEAVYQPSKAWSFNANVTYQDGTLFGTFFYEQTGSYLDFYPVGYIVDGKSGTGKGSPDYSGYAPPNGKIRSPGVPQLMGNAYVKYDFADHWSIGAGPMYQGHMDANDEGSLIIRAQTEWDGFVKFHTKRYSVQVSVKNFTNARLYDPIDVTFAGNDEIMPRPPITASLTLRYYF
jgi:outer membrane receptor protein involved in Fe transport